METFAMYPRQSPMKPHPGQIKQMFARARNPKLSMFTVFSGSAGSGKSLVLAWYIIRWWIETGLPVYSNMHVRFQNFETLNFDLVDIVNQTLRNCMVAIDELQGWADRRNWANMRGKLFQYALMQKRKGEMHLAGSIQNYQWLEDRVGFQVDNQIRCIDAYFLNQENDQIPDWMKLPGQLIKLHARDRSGKMTGFPYDMTHREYESTIGPCWPIWDWYDSFQEQDITESFRKVRMDLREQVFSDKPQAIATAEDQVDSETDEIITEMFRGKKTG